MRGYVRLVAEALKVQVGYLTDLGTNALVLSIARMCSDPMDGASFLFRCLLV